MLFQTPPGLFLICKRVLFTAMFVCLCVCVCVCGGGGGGGRGGEEGRGGEQGWEEGESLRILESAKDAAFHDQCIKITFA